MNDKLPVVSVIVTTYNRERYLRETVQSIVNQTFTDFELIVVDNFSNYDFFKAIDDVNDPRIRAFQNQNYGVIAVNRNYGIAKARGQYLAFCDDDDLWVEDKLDNQIRVVEDKMILASNLNVINDESEVIGQRIFNQYESIYDIYIHNYIALSSVLLMRSDEIHFEEDTNLVGIEDYSLWLNLIHRGYDVFIMPQKLVNYRVCSSNYSNRDNKLPLRRIDLLYKIFKKYKNTNCIGFIKAIIYNIRVYFQYYIFNR